jgi:hypothetical protein
VKTLKQIINDFEPIDESTKDECQEKFEKLVFSYKGREKDTREENKIYPYIKDWFVGNYMKTNSSGGANISKELRASFEDLEACREYYKKALQPPKGFVYRGTKLNNDVVKTAIIKGHKSITTSKLRLQTFMHIPYEYKATKSISSWTTEFKIARGFGSEGNSDDMVIIKVEIKGSGKDWLFSPDFSNMVSNQNEYEVIRLNNKKEKGHLIIREQYYNQLLKELKERNNWTP